MSTDPAKHEDESLPQLPEDSIHSEDLSPFEPEASEPIGELHFIEEALHPDAALLFELSTEEPDPTELSFDDLDDLSTADASIGIEAFAPQPALPSLPWQLDALLLELHHTVRAELEPGLEHTLLERPGGSDRPLEVTIRIRMFDLPVSLPVIDAPIERLRIGRDLLAGRMLIRIDTP